MLLPRAQCPSVFPRPHLHDKIQVLNSTVNGHLKCKLHKGMHFSALLTFVSTASEIAERTPLKGRREQGERESRKEEEQEGNREGGERMLSLLRLCGVFSFSPSLLIVILCHNYSTWEDSCLIILVAIIMTGLTIQLIQIFG